MIESGTGLQNDATQFVQSPSSLGHLCSDYFDFQVALMKRGGLLELQLLRRFFALLIYLLKQALAAAHQELLDYVCLLLIALRRAA